MIRIADYPLKRLIKTQPCGNRWMWFDSAYVHTVNPKNMIHEINANIDIIYT